MKKRRKDIAKYLEGVKLPQCRHFNTENKSRRASRAPIGSCNDDLRWGYFDGGVAGVAGVAGVPLPPGVAGVARVARVAEVAGAAGVAPASAVPVETATRMPKVR